MAKTNFKKGDFISFFPGDQAGHEQKGRRPGLVVSNNLFNQNSSLIFVCPITNSSDSYPFHIPIPSGNKVKGVVMTEQLRALDFKARRMTVLGSAPEELTETVVAVIAQILK